MGGHRPHRLADRRDWLLARIAEKPDLTLRAIKAELADAGVRVSYGALWAFFMRQRVTFKGVTFKGVTFKGVTFKGVTFKKSLHASEQERPDIARRRARWKKCQGRLDAKRLVVIDATPACAGAGSGLRPL
jgi:hypothetical protein